MKQWNKKTVVDHYHSVLDNNQEAMTWIHKDLNDSEVLIVFKLPELLHSCSKWIKNLFKILFRAYNFTIKSIPDVFKYASKVS